MISFRACQARTAALLLHEAGRLEALAHDLRALAAGDAPDPDVLKDAAVIDQWRFDQRPMTTMVGTLVGHPRLPNGPVHTTEIWAIDAGLGWARTLSRFYVLGQQQATDAQGE